MERLNKSELQKLLMERICGLWQSPWDSSRLARVTHNFIRDVSFVENRQGISFGLYLGFLLTSDTSFNAFFMKEATRLLGLACVRLRTGNMFWWFVLNFLIAEI